MPITVKPLTPTQKDQVNSARAALEVIEAKLKAMQKAKDEQVAALQGQIEQAQANHDVKAAVLLAEKAQHEAVIGGVADVAVVEG